MISFRYHLVSIVAVFLALALGVLVGTTVVNEGLIQDLDRRTDDAVQTADDLRRQVSEVREELRVGNEFAQAVERLVIEDRLAGREVVMVTLEGVDASDVETVRRALEAAGASVVAEMVVTARMALNDEAARTDLAAAIGMPTSIPVEELSEAAAQRFGSRLVEGANPVNGDLLAELSAGGFVDVQSGSAVEEIGGDGQAVVLLAGGSNPPAVDPAVLAGVAETLAQAFHPVLAAETLDSQYPFVQLVRDNGGIDDRIVTVDNADVIPGRVAVVLGLQDILVTPGRGGHYGVKEGASDLLPPP